MILNKDSIGNRGRFAPIGGEDKFLPIVFGHGLDKDVGMVSNTEYLGIEVEVEQILTNSSHRKLPNGTYLWQSKEDGSLRNNGREFVSIPLLSGYAEEALTDLKTFFHKNARCKGYEFTPRTSIHVHINVQDLSWDELRKFILLYIAVEPVLYNFCGGNRHKNIYCVPLNQAAIRHTLSQFFSFNSDESMFRVTHDWQKYCGLNLKTVNTYGTVEFRHMIGTLDIPKLKRWINLIISLKQASKKSNIEVLKESIFNLNTSSEYFVFLSELFGMEEANSLQFNSLKERMEEMIEFTKALFGNNENELLTSLIEKKEVKEGLLSNILLSSGYFIRRAEEKKGADLSYFSAVHAGAHNIILNEAGRRVDLNVQPLQANPVPQRQPRRIVPRPAAPVVDLEEDF